jgi:hypothetical protein
MTTMLTCCECKKKFKPATFQAVAKQKGLNVFCSGECKAVYNNRLKCEKSKGRPATALKADYGRPGEKSQHSYRYWDAVN